MQWIQDAPLWLHIMGVGLLGLSVGSFVNVVIYRLPLILANRDCDGNAARWSYIVGEDCVENRQPYALDTAAQEHGIDRAFGRHFMLSALCWPSSHCPGCKHRLSCLDLIPLISYLSLRGCCRYCQSPIHVTYIVVELLCGALCIAAYLRFGITVEFAAICFLLLNLCTLSVIDIKNMILPDEITLPLLWVGLLANLNGQFSPLPAAVVGAVCSYLFLCLVNFLFVQLRKKPGIGRGDMKLAAALGAWFGWVGIFEIILLAALLSIAASIPLLAFKKWSRDTYIPLGPFLSLAAGAMIFLPNTMLPLLVFHG